MICNYNSCHNDDGEASEAYMDFVVAYIGFAIKQAMIYAPTEIQGYLDQVESCSDEQLGALSRIGSIDFDYVPSDDDIPSVDRLTRKLTSGNVLTPNEERAIQFSERMEEVVKKSGLGGMPMLRK